MRRWLVLVVLVAACAGSSSSSAGTRAAGGCLDAWDAISAFQNGSMSPSAAASKMESAAADVRAAARDNPKYTPIAQWIVGAEGEITSGRGLGANAGELYAECGPGRK